LEQHGGRVPAGLWARVVQRLLALNAAIWFNWQIGAPTKRSCSPTTTNTPPTSTKNHINDLAVALLAGAAALVALQLRTGIDQPERLVAGTLMFAVIYLAVGAVTGALVRNPVNGTVLILFVWILDVFFGPTVSPDKPATRLLPTHFLSLWMVDLPSHHGGRLGDLGWALAWTLAAAALGWAVIVSTSRGAHPPRWRTHPGSARDQLAAAVRMGWRDWRRNRVLWALLVVVPAVFIWLRRDHPRRHDPPQVAGARPTHHRDVQPRRHPRRHHDPHRHRLAGRAGRTVRGRRRPRR
jgi:hypothetical protein